MNDADPPTSTSVDQPGWIAFWHRLSPEGRQSLTRFLVLFGVLTLAFIKPLVSLMAYAWHTELHSHIVLIPLVSAYLISLQLHRLPARATRSPGAAAVPFMAGLVALGAAWKLSHAVEPLSHNDQLALVTTGYLCLLVAAGLALLGRKWLAAVAFPIAFLAFMIPLPDGLVDFLETASKTASAEATSWYFSAARVPFLRDGQIFQLPGITLEVASECSGIRSSWVLFITSLVASHLFLRSPWRKIVLVALIIPLGVLRNGFRILVIGWLCVEIGPEMIDSYIHHRGGPIFFALSMIPLFLLLWGLRRGELRKEARRKADPGGGAATGSPHEASA